MNLLWHIVAKELRRLRLPAALWLVFVGGTALYFALVPQIDPRGYDTWLAITGAFTLLVGGAQFFIGFVLTGVLVLEDPVIGTDAFWPTRPITRRRLFAAKAITAVLLFVIAPTLVLIPAWGVAGFSPGEMATAATEAVLKHATVTAFALAMGGLSANLAQFLFSALAVVVLHAVCGAAGMTLLTTPEVALDVRHSRNYLVQMMVLPAFAGLAVHQYLSRSRSKGWLLVTGFLVVTALVRNFWPWSIDAIVTKRPAPESDSYQQRITSERAAEAGAGGATAASETRIREGATLSTGSSRVTILHIARDPVGAPTALVLEERDSWLGQHEGWDGSPRLNRSTIRADRYVLRTGLGVQMLETRPGDRVVHSSLSIAVSWVDLPVGITDETLADAVLMKVRYKKQ